MNSFDYITNFASGVKSAKVSIRRPISQDGVKGINGDNFAKELEFLAAQGVEEVTIDINSVGGSIKEGFSIFSAIKDAPFKTITRVIGLAASMAGIISQAGDHRVIVDFGLFHAHGPQVPKGAKVDATLLDKMLGSLKTMISAKAELSEAKVSEMLSKETVLTAVEATEMGFFDEIEQTRGIKPELIISNDIEALFMATNKFLINNNKMDKLGTLLAIENATEELVISSVETLQAEAAKVEGLTNDLEAEVSKVEGLTNDLEAVKAEKEAEVSKVAELEASLTELKGQAATELIENAVKLGKIKADVSESWITAATNDLEGTKILLSGVTTSVKAPDLTNEINPDEKESRKDWDFQKWGQEDPKGLEEMKNKTPKKFDDLLGAYLES